LEFRRVLFRSGAGAMEPLWSELARIAIPCTFVAGEDDAPYVAWARRLAGAVPGSTRELLSRAGHAVYMRRPAVFARVLAAHLGRADGAAAAGASASSVTSA